MRLIERMLPHAGRSELEVYEPSVDVRVDESHAHRLTHALRRVAPRNIPSAGGRKTRTQVLPRDVPVMTPSKVSPSLPLSSIAAADLRTWRSTLLAASSWRVQCSAIAASSSTL